MFLLSKKKIVKVVSSVYTYSEKKNNPIVSKTDDIDFLCIERVTLDKLSNLPDARSDDIFWTLKQLVKMRTSIVNSNIEYKNKLHAQLLHHYSNYDKFFFKFDGKSALSMRETYPSPDILKQSTVAEFATFLKEVSGDKLGKEKSIKIFGLIDKCDISVVDFQPERNPLIKSLVRQIRYNAEQLVFLDNEISIVMEKTGYKLDTFIGLDKVSSAQIVSEIGNINRFNSPDKLARDIIINDEK